MRRSRGAWPWVWFVPGFGGLLASFIAVANVTGQDRPEPSDFGPPVREFYGRGGPKDGFSGFGRPDGSHSLGRISESFLDTTISKGFVFIDGEYLSPPYEIRQRDGTLTINDRPLTCEPPQRSYGFSGRGGDGPRNSVFPRRWPVGEATGPLGIDQAIVSFENQPFVPLDGEMTYNLLKSMLKQNGRSVGQVAVIERLPAEFDKQVWDRWVADFEMPDSLKQRAAAYIASYDMTQRQAESQIQARRWMERLAYPLSVGGMLLCVLAIGHLLGGRPHAGQPTTGVDDSAAMLRALNWSLLFTVAFSMFDLVWTIVAASNNQMTELNPIGSHLIHDPRHLAGFKIGITLPALALLWLLRRHKRAQVAAWWVCLVLTLVTIRWLTVSSGFEMS